MRDSATTSPQQIALVGARSNSSLVAIVIALLAAIAVVVYFAFVNTTFGAPPLDAATPAGPSPAIGNAR